MNRGLEIALALMLAIVLLPLGLMIALAILIVDGRPVFFIHPRMKTPGTSFRMFKFRTMRRAATQGVTGGDKADQITPFGAVLRTTRLDEIPQLFNILRGDMAFVGPRPPEKAYVIAEPEIYARVLRMRPGVTGLATLVLHRREKNLLLAATTAQEVDQVYRRRCLLIKARIDMIYMRKKSLANDVWLIALTFAGLFAGRSNRRLWRSQPTLAFRNRSLAKTTHLISPMFREI